MPEHHTADAQGWVPLDPGLRRRSKAHELFLGHVRALARLSLGPRDEAAQLELEKVRKMSVAAADTLRTKDRERLVAALCVATDLVAQGWEVRNIRGRVKARRPSSSMSSPLDEKARVRLQLLAERDAQLRQDSVRAFVAKMERPRRHQGRLVSIFNLMRDGRELAETLSSAAEHSSDNGRCDVLTEAIRPYLQILEGNERCEHTGLALREVWRYFRHTWSNAYQSVPGRTMMILVRDAAADDHPVIGLAALSSPPVQIHERDEWIGWAPTVFLESVKQSPTRKIALWLDRTVEAAIDETLTSDLIEDALLTRSELRAPTTEVVQRLRDEGRRARDRHHELMGGNEYKRAIQGKDWPKIARMELFRSKRCLRLAGMLEVRAVLREFFCDQPTVGGLRRLIATHRGRSAIQRVLRQAKAERVGTLVADISVCGAIAPYNPILGGKLVAMLVTSPEVISAYRRRYADSPSVIASGMAGRPVVRDASLALLTTSSLYAVGASQYNRISIPGEVLGAEDGQPLRYRRVAITGGYGSGQFGPATVQALKAYLEQSAGYSRVNSVFGEGVNPRMRKIRGALEHLGFPADDLLRHGSQRLVYAMPMVSNLRDFLLGIDARPRYRFGGRRSGTSAIASWWIHRWLSGRIDRPGVLEAVGRHTFVHPIQHGARVPTTEDGPEQLPFPDLQLPWR